MKRHAERIAAGVRHLRRADPVMKDLIRRCPPLTDLRMQPNRFGILVHSILSQQISVHAARSIRARLTEQVGPGGLTPENVAALDLEMLRSIGISRQKAAYLLDLAEKARDGVLRLDAMGRWKDDRVIEELIQVKGIGVWTAQMFLIFSLGRLDVFPHEDYGVRAAIRRLYGLEELPDKATCLEVGGPWRPWATIASWYCWRSLELERKSGGGV